MLSVHLADADATAALGARLADALRARSGGVIFLHGDLGAGKTTFARGFLRACGVSGTLRSPTYTLMEPYAVQERRFLHMDLYRLNDPAELEQLGLDDFSPQDTLWLVEWPERGGTHLPVPDVSIQLAVQAQARQAVIESKAAMDFK